MEPFAGMTLLITGAGSGIGRETARMLAAAGAELILVGRKTGPLRETLPSARHVVLDHNDEGAVEAFAATCPSLDGMFLNAGQLETGSLEESSIGLFDRMIQANLRGPWLMCHHLGPRLKEGASVVLTGSNIGIRALPGNAAYGIAKAGVHMMARILAAEWGPRGIRCNAIAPGPVLTEMLRVRFRDADHEREMLAALGKVNPMGRMGQEADIAAMALHLLGPGSRWTNGTIIPVDGGATGVF